MRIRTITSLAAVLLAAGLLTGCNDKSESQKKPTPPPVVNLKPTERVELMPESSDEFLERHYVDISGFEVETRIEYRNGDKAVIKFRGDHSQLSYIRAAKDGTVRVEENFGPDGKSIASGRELRPDGTLRWTAEQNSAGEVTTITYWFDGKSVFSTKKQTTVGGASDTTFLRKDGTTWVKQSATADGVITREDNYDDSGKLTSFVEHSGQTFVYTVLRDDGTRLYELQGEMVKASYGPYFQTTIVSSKEFAADGKTLVRKFIMGPQGYSPRYIERPNGDGTTTVRTVNYDGTVTHEEKRNDATGQTISQRDVPASKGLKDLWDYHAINEPTTDDPQGEWTSEEQYPQFRH